MGWFSRKRTQSNPQRGHVAICVGDTESKRKVSNDVMDQLVRATKRPAWQALDQYFGTGDWYSESWTAASLEGPSIWFSFNVRILPGHTLRTMFDRISLELNKAWDRAAENLS